MHPLLWVAFIVFFAIFNVADSAVSVGCVLLFIDLLFLKGKRYMADPPKGEGALPEESGAGPVE